MLERFALIFSQPLAALRRRIEVWVMSRTPRQPGPVAITRRRVYILPTRFGYGYAGLVLVVLLGAMNYSNSLVFALGFLLAGLGLAAMYQTHGNLVNLELGALHCKPVFAGDEAAFEFDVFNPTQCARFTIDIGWADTNRPTHIDIPATEHSHVALKRNTLRRGWLDAPRFAVGTEFPLGLFRAWSWIEVEQRCLVYPRPEGTRRIPPSGGIDHGSGVAMRQSQGQDEFAGLRAYQPGDHPRSIHWKSLPKLRQPMVKQFAETQDRMLWLDWSATPAATTEARLSQLTRWVLIADGNRCDYGLRLPTQQFTPAHGSSHRHRCLQALALFKGTRQ